MILLRMATGKKEWADKPGANIGNSSLFASLAHNNTGGNGA